MALVVLLSTYVPEILIQGLVTRLFLRVERGSVGSDGREVLPAHIHCTADTTKALTCQGLVGGDGSGAGDGRQTAELKVTTLGAGCWRLAVRAQNHFLICRVSGLLVDFCQSAGNSFDGVCPFYFSHFVFGSRSADRRY